jgi:hypothetical protein
MKKSQKTALPRQGSAAKAGSGITGLLKDGLSSSFEALRGKIGDTLSDKGEGYLETSITKLNKTTSQLVKWSKKHPVKLACGIAAVMAVSTFLVHTMKAGPPAVTTKLKKLKKAI